MKTKYYIGLLVVLFVIVFSYTFDPKLSIGGDNCVYYSYATSIVSGEGYRDIVSPEAAASNTFPPGYPLLMSPVRFFTDSVIAQKILNGIFLLISSIVIFFFARSLLRDERMAFVLGAVALVNYRVLEFASLMMSETSYLMCSVFVILLVWLLSQEQDKRWWRDWRFYLLVLLSGFCFEIRTQGITLIVAVAVYMLFNKRWIQTLAYCAGAYIVTLPWAIRNMVSGVGGSRYIDQIAMVNHWRPEEGYVSFSEIISRGFETLQMLISQAVPNSVMPYLQVNYELPPTAAQWLVGVIIIALIIYGFLRLGKMSMLFISYAVFTFGIICLWSAPSENRYITTILPLLEMGLVLGVYSFIGYLCDKWGIKSTLNPMWLLLPIMFFVAPQLRFQNALANMDYVPHYKNFFKIGEAVKENAVKGVVVCSRKPQLFYMFSHAKGCNYKYTSDKDELIRGLIDSNVDLVVLDQLGYSSTAIYLWPAIEANQDLFPVIMHLPEPDTYLLAFDRDKAIKKMNR